MVEMGVTVTIYYFAVGCAVFLGIKGRDGKWPFEDNTGEMSISF